MRVGWKRNMNKEEVLDVLRAISIQLGEGNEVEQRISDMEALKSIIEDTKYEIKYLNERLSDDSNYKMKFSLLLEESVRDEFEERLTLTENEKQRNLESVRDYQEKIESTRRRIAELENYIEVANAEYQETSEEMRDSLGLTEEEFEKQRANMAEKNADIKQHEEELETLKNNLADYQKQLELFSAESERLNGEIEETRKQLEKYNLENSQEDKIDESAKEDDKRKLKEAEARLKEYERAESKLSYDLEGQIQEIIEGYRNGSISHDELISRMKEFKESLRDEHIEKDIEQRYYSEEYTANNNAIYHLRLEIADLEARIADDDNYAVSPFVIEKNNRGLKKIERCIANIDKKIANYSAGIEYFQGEIDAANSLIEELKLENAEIQRKIRKAGDAIDSEFEKELLAKIDSNSLEIKSLENERDAILKTQEHDKSELELLKASKERNNNLLSNWNASLERRNSINSSKKRLDEIELFKKKSCLEALEKRSLVSNTSLIENIEKLISSSEMEKDIEASREKGVQVSEEKVVNQDSKTVIADNSSMDPIELGDTRGWRVKYSGKEDENLAKKAKNSKFVKALKLFFVGVLCVIPFTRGIGVSLGVLGLTTGAIKKIMKKAQMKPQNYVNATKDSIEKEIIEQLKVEGIDMEKKPEKSNSEEVLVEQQTKKSEDEIIINTNDGENFSVNVSETLNHEEVIEKDENSKLGENDTIENNQSGQDDSIERVDELENATSLNREKLVDVIKTVMEETEANQEPLQETEVDENEQQKDGRVR